MGLDTKTYRLTDRQWQCDFDFDFDIETKQVQFSSKRGEFQTADNEFACYIWRLRM
jgi:hypothetical protein